MKANEFSWRKPLPQSKRPYPLQCENALMPRRPANTQNNYLGIPAWQRDAFVYRIVKTERLLRFLRTGENVLVKPALWEDPFENFILKSHFIRKGEPVVIGH